MTVQCEVASPLIAWSMLINKLSWKYFPLNALGFNLDITGIHETSTLRNHAHSLYLCINWLLTENWLLTWKWLLSGKLILHKKGFSPEVASPQKWLISQNLFHFPLFQMDQRQLFCCEVQYKFIPFHIIPDETKFVI